MSAHARTILAGLLALFVPKRAHAAAPEASRVVTLNAGALLDAIAEVETRHEHWRIGRAGERGRCQFMASTWGRYTNADFAQWASRDCDLTRRIERAHLDYLVRSLFQRGQIPEPMLIAAAWRHGLGGAVKNVRGDYARRVVNLYWDKVGKKGAQR